VFDAEAGDMVSWVMVGGCGVGEDGIECSESKSVG
jgi:hypothetical protein